MFATSAASFQMNGDQGEEYLVKLEGASGSLQSVIMKGSEKLSSRSRVNECLIYR